jgi:glutathione S-transferase
VRLYYAPLACSLADHIALHEAGADLDLVRVDMRSKLTETGQDFHQISTKGYVPALAFMSTESHRAFKPMWHGGTDRDRARAATTVTGLLTLLAGTMQGDYLFGDHLSVADCYLFVMLLWAERFGVEVPDAFTALRDRMRTRPAVQRAMATEGLL